MYGWDTNMVWPTYRVTMLASRYWVHWSCHWAFDMLRIVHVQVMTIVV